MSDIQQSLPEKLMLVSFIFCLILFLFFVFVSINKPFIFDEADYAGISRGILKRGLPFYYHSEEHTERFDAGGRYFEGEFGLYHQPLLFSYVLTIFFRLFAESNFTGRTFGVLCNLGVLVLMFLIVRSLYPQGKKRIFVALASACLALINPLHVQASTLIDIDNTVLVLLLALFIFVFLRCYNAGFLDKVISRSSIMLGVILTLLLWTKLTTPLFLPVAIFLFYSLNGRIKHGLILSLFIFTVGIGLFLITWGIFCKVFNWSFTRVFEITFSRFLQLSGSFDWRERIRALKWDIFWFSPGFCLCFIVAGIERIRRYIEYRKCELIDLFLIFCILMFIMYTVVIPNPFPKYKFPAVFLLSILISDLMYGMIPRMIKKELKVSLIVIIGLAFYYFFLFPDIFLILWSKTRVTFNPFRADFFNSKTIRIIFYLMPLFILPILWKIARKSYRWRDAVALSALVVLIPSNIVLGFKQSLGNYPTIYWYGERGFKETVDYIKTHSSLDDLFITRKDISYYTGRRYYFDYALLDIKKFKRLLSEKPIKYIVFSDSSGYLSNEETRRALDMCCKLEKKIGDFYIYVPHANY